MILCKLHLEKFKDRNALVVRALSFLLWALFFPRFPTIISTNLLTEDSLKQEVLKPYLEGIVALGYPQHEKAASHYSQQTNTQTENQTRHVLIHKWKLNNEKT